MPTKSPESRRALRTMGGFVASLALHLAFVGFALTYGALPSLDFELADPMELRFGGEEEVEVEMMPGGATATNTASSANADQQGGANGAGDAGVRSRDAGVREAAGLLDASADGGDVDLDAGDADFDASDADFDAGDVDLDGGIPDGGGDAGSVRYVASASTEGRMRLPPGAAVALRFDLLGIRDSVLADEVTGLLTTNPDFQKVIGGSGIDPVADLDQFLMASPVPYDRERYLYVGRTRYDVAWAEARTAEVAASHGATVSWGVREGFPSADWHDDDFDTAHRVILLLDAQHILVCREQDVRDALAWLSSVARTAHGASGAAGAVGLGPDELFGVQVDGTRRYVVGDATELPTSMRASIVRDGDAFALRFRGDYPTPEETSAGATFWTDKRDQLSASLRNGFLTRGHAAMLDAIAIAATERSLRADTSLGPRQAEAIMQAVRDGMPALYETLSRAQRADRNR